jgi:hypothetical protein
MEGSLFLAVDSPADGILLQCRGLGERINDDPHVLAFAIGVRGYKIPRVVVVIHFWRLQFDVIISITYLLFSAA